MARIEKTVFISYRRADEPWALAIFQDLTQHGYDVFIDYDGIASGNFETIILENIRARAHFLALLTPTALERCGDPKDWMRREIEAALDSQRNIVPLMLEGFDFGTPALANQLTGKLAALKDYNGLEIPKARFFSSEMERLRDKFLNVPVDAVLHSASHSAQQAATEQKDKATSGTPAVRYQQGILLRQETPRESHADLGPRNPVKILASSDRARIPEFLPVRYGRMLTSPFAFLRGGAAVMAQDLKNEPSAGIAVQACGDCHLMNFGAFATPERNIVFDINDFDETLPGVDFTVDLKRLVASVVVAALAAKFPVKRARVAATTTVAAYRQHMAALAKLSPLEIRHSRIDLMQEVGQIEDRKLRKNLKDMVEKAAKTAEHDDNFPQMAEGAKIEDRPPLIYHVEPTQHRVDIDKVFVSYKRSLPTDSLRVFEQYTLRDTALSATGVGSVGTLCIISLFTSKDGAPLFLQLKEAGTSVLECLGPKFEGHPGQRVADGQRILQATGDIFLGWADDAVSGRHFYVRQLRNRRIGFIGELVKKNAFEEYARLCANALACAHARSADPAVIAGYMGEDDAFDDALSSFAMVYAARTQEDYDLLVKASRDGRLKPAK